MKIAIITGASSGLGIKLFEELISQRTEIDEYWLVARRRERLQALSVKHPDKKIKILSLDLTDNDAIQELSGLLKDSAPQVMVLINNAGYGKLGDSWEIPLQDQTDMITLNCRALTGVTLAALPYMIKGSEIINIASIAAFMPTPRMTVYSATKSYVYAYSKAMRRELKSKGVNVLAVCPGPMETEFLEVADIKGRSSFFAMLPRCDVSTVATKTIKKSGKKRGIYTDKIVYKIYRVLTKVLPHGMIMKKL